MFRHYVFCTLKSFELKPLLELHLFHSSYFTQHLIMAPTLCGKIVQSKRSFLAVTWTIVNLLVLLSYITAILYTFTVPRLQSYQNNKNNNYYYNEENPEKDREQQQQDRIFSSRSIIFAYSWTLVLSLIMALYGTVILGIASIFSGQYYWCCTHAVHKTTPLAIGGFIGSLLMYANMTLLCSVMFGEFNIRDRNDRPEGAGDDYFSISSMAFSILCVVLTLLYLIFAAILYAYSSDLIQENAEDERLEGLAPSDCGDDIYGYKWQPNLNRSGVLGDNFNVGGKGALTSLGSEGYVHPSVSDETGGYNGYALG